LMHFLKLSQLCQVFSQFLIFIVFFTQFAIGFGFSHTLSFYWLSIQFHI
jgi:hypothetical protein